MGSGLAFVVTVVAHARVGVIHHGSTVVALLRQAGHGAILGAVVAAVRVVVVAVTCSCSVVGGFAITAAPAPAAAPAAAAPAAAAATLKVISSGLRVCHTPPALASSRCSPCDGGRHAQVVQIMWSHPGRCTGG